MQIATAMIPVIYKNEKGNLEYSHFYHHWIFYPAKKNICIPTDPNKCIITGNAKISEGCDFDYSFMYIK